MASTDHALELAAQGTASPGVQAHRDDREAARSQLLSYLNGSFARVPSRRLVRPEEAAQAFLFLASAEASADHGIDLRADGGLTASWYIPETLPED